MQAAQEVQDQLDVEILPEAPTYQSQMEKKAIKEEPNVTKTKYDYSAHVRTQKNQSRLNRIKIEDDYGDQNR